MPQEGTFLIPGQTLQDFFATENMAYADAVKAGVGIDPDRRAYHMFIKSGLTDNQINHIYGFVYDPDVEGPSTALDPRKIQEAALRFYDKTWDVDRHRYSIASMGRYSRPLMGHSATTHRHQTSYPRSRAGNKGSYMQEPWEDETFLTEDGYEYNDWDESWQQYPAEEYDDWEEGTGLEAFLAGSTGTCWTPILLTLTWRKNAVLTRTCTKPFWCTRRLVTF